MAAAICHGAAWCAAFGVATWRVPRYERIYRDFKMEIPAPTRLVISFTHFLYDNRFVLLAPIAVWSGLIFLLAAESERAEDRPFRRIVFLLAALLPLILAGAATIASAWPLEGLIIDLSRGR